MAHGALVLLPLLSLELPMLQAFWLLARGIGEGPASPFQQVWEGRIALKTFAAKRPAGDDVCSPKPQADGLAAKDYL